MAITFDLLGSTVLTVATAQVDMTSIDQTYTDLFVVIAPTEETANSNGVRYRFNSNSSSIYEVAYSLATNGSTLSSFGETTTWGATSYYAAPDTNTGQNRCLIRLNIFQYANTNVTKTCLFEFAKPTNGIDIGQTLWASTSAISSISFMTTGTTSNKLDVGTAIYIYGIKAA